ncbi:MAG TPA: DoxX family membrane protein [Anaeromyxobacteraceae bacterium]|nr:DoxX family membrane protein [Anaeromyxobacteraceae bacterium]
MTSAFATLAPLLSRLLLSAIFAYSGYHKFSQTGRAASSIAGHGLPFATAAAYASGAFELLVALLLVLGLRARTGALAACVYVAVVSYIFHFHPALRGDASQMLHLLKNAGIMGGLLLLACHGPGPASVDQR